MGSFFDLPDTNTNSKRTNITDYIDLRKGEVTVQFLTKPVTTYKHWVYTDGRKLPFTCLKDACPICDMNKKIEATGDPDNDPDYIGMDRRYASNVVDISPVKVCPECEEINTRNATKCQNDECNHILVDVDPQPLNMVRYLEGTWTLYEGNLKGAEAHLSDLYPDKDLRKVPMTIRSTKTKNRTAYTIIPTVDHPDAVDPEQYGAKDMHDLTQTGITLTPDELRIIMNGGSFKELMASKRGDNNNKEEVDNIFS